MPDPGKKHRPAAESDPAAPDFNPAEQLRAFLNDVARARMPFGKFGPDHYPPNGFPVYDLPLEYLQWFATRGGFPKGKLGSLMAQVHAIKAEGADSVFDPLRRAAGGRQPVRTPRKSKTYTFQDPEDGRRGKNTPHRP